MRQGDADMSSKIQSTQGERSNMEDPPNRLNQVNDVFESDKDNGVETQNIINSLSKFGQGGDAELSAAHQAEQFQTFSAVVSNDQLKTQDARITV